VRVFVGIFVVLVQPMVHCDRRERNRLDKLVVGVVMLGSTRRTKLKVRLMSLFSHGIFRLQFVAPSNLPEKSSRNVLDGGERS